MNQKSKRILPRQHLTSRGHPTSLPLISVTSHLWVRLNKTMKHYTQREYVLEKWQSLKNYPACLPLTDSTPYWSPQMWNEIQKLSGGSGCWKNVASALIVQFRLTLGARGSHPSGHACPQVSWPDLHDPPHPSPRPNAKRKQKNPVKLYFKRIWFTT